MEFDEEDGELVTNPYADYRRDGIPQRPGCGCDRAFMIRDRLMVCSDCGERWRDKLKEDE